jgi:hypothetical protein
VLAQRVRRAGSGGRGRAPRTISGTAETGPTADEDQNELRTLDRWPSGTPVDWKQRDRHRHAAQDWLAAAIPELRGFSVASIVGDIERECPWHYVEWKEFNAPLVPEGLEPERLHDAS